MSRIHDALKKAAEERASNSQAHASETFVDLTEGKGRSSHGGGGVETTATKEAVRVDKPVPVRFEELLRRCTRPNWTLDPSMSVFAGTETQRMGAEPFRTLRSRLTQIATIRPLKRVLVTSSVPEEGKTFVAANLAQSIVRQPDRRVLLIDADLRASRLHVALGAPATPGLSDYLRGQVNEFEIIQSGPQENLCFIPGGNQASNPSELLLGERMRRLLEMVTPIFDFVILDSPPATPVHDPSFLADWCDGVLFVVRAGVTNFEMAQKAVAEFQEKNLLGVVLNAAQWESGYSGYGKYLDGYGGD